MPKENAPVMIHPPFRPEMFSKTFWIFSHGPIVVPRIYLCANPLEKPPLHNNWPAAMDIAPKITLGDISAGSIIYLHEITSAPPSLAPVVDSCCVLHIILVQRAILGLGPILA